MKNTLKDFWLCLSFEWWSSTKQNIGNDTYAPDINLVIVILLLNYFRSHVERRAKNILQTFLRVVEAGKAEVCYLDV